MQQGGTLFATTRDAPVIGYISPEIGGFCAPAATTHLVASRWPQDTKDS